MPVPSLNPDKARQGGGGVEAGNYEVTAANFRNIKTDFKPNQPCLVFDAATLDKDGAVVRGADPVSIIFGFGEKSAEAFHPGNKKSSDDTEAEDAGDQVDAEGNCIYCADTDAQFNRSSGALVFMDSLVKAGFPKTLLDQCWAPGFVGLKFQLGTLASTEVNKKYGTRLNTKPLPDGGTVTYKVCEKWLNPNYLEEGKAGKKGTGKAAAATTEEPKAEAGTNGNKPESVEDVTKSVLAIVARVKAGTSFKSLPALVGHFTNEFSKSKQDPGIRTKCQDLLKDEDFLISAVADLGGTYEDGVVKFPKP